MYGFPGNVVFQRKEITQNLASGRCAVDGSSGLGFLWVIFGSLPSPFDGPFGLAS